MIKFHLAKVDKDNSGLACPGQACVTLKNTEMMSKILCNIFKRIVGMRLYMIMNARPRNKLFSIIPQFKNIFSRNCILNAYNVKVLHSV